MSFAIDHMVYIVDCLEEMQNHVLCVYKMLPNPLSLTRYIGFCSVIQSIWEDPNCSNCGRNS